MASSQVFILPIIFRFLQCIDDHSVVTVVSIVPLTDINIFLYSYCLRSKPKPYKGFYPFPWFMNGLGLIDYVFLFFHKLHIFLNKMD